MIERETNKLNTLIEKHYDRGIDIAQTMSWLPKVTIPVSPGEEYSQEVDDFLSGKTPDLETVQALLDDLCRQGVLEEDYYVISRTRHNAKSPEGSQHGSRSEIARPAQT